MFNLRDPQQNLKINAAFERSRGVELVYGIKCKISLGGRRDRVLKKNVLLSNVFIILKWRRLVDVVWKEGKGREWKGREGGRKKKTSS